MPTVNQVRRRGSTRPATVTSTVDGRDHLVSASAASVGLAAGHEKSVALCGRLVVAAPLTVPPGPTCFDCETALHRVTVGGKTSYRRGGLMARLLRRRTVMAGSSVLWRSCPANRRTKSRSAPPARRVCRAWRRRAVKPRLKR